MFQIVTRQDMREAFDRQAREGQRIEEANQQRTDLKAGLQTERNQFVRGQVEERDRLTERHKGEDRQLQEAVAHRQALDRTAEIHARNTAGQTITRQLKGV